MIDDIVTWQEGITGPPLGPVGEIYLLILGSWEQFPYDQVLDSRTVQLEYDPGIDGTYPFVVHEFMDEWDLQDLATFWQSGIFSLAATVRWGVIFCDLTPEELTQEPLWFPGYG